MSSSPTKPFVPEAQSLQRAGIGNDAIEAWRASMPLDTGDFTGDCARYAPFWAVTKHADIMQIAAQPQRFSSAKGITLPKRCTESKGESACIHFPRTERE